MGKSPGFWFFTGDWLKDPELRFCSIFARGLLVDLLCYMFESNERGYLSKPNGEPRTDIEIIDAISGGARDEKLDALAELESSGVLSRDNRGVLYSRRIARLSQISDQRSKAGSKGGSKTQAKLKQTDKQTDKQKPGDSDSDSDSVTTGILLTENKKKKEKKKKAVVGRHFAGTGKTSFRIACTFVYSVKIHAVHAIHWSLHVWKTLFVDVRRLNDGRWSRRFCGLGVRDIESFQRPSRIESQAGICAHWLRGSCN